MKRALKKVFSLMLVAMLLVTAIPFQASAAETYDNYEVKFVCNGTPVGSYPGDTVGIDLPLDQDTLMRCWSSLGISGYEDPVADGALPVIENNHRVWTVNLTPITTTDNSNNTTTDNSNNTTTDNSNNTTTDNSNNTTTDNSNTITDNSITTDNTNDQTPTPDQTPRYITDPQDYQAFQVKFMWNGAVVDVYDAPAGEVGVDAPLDQGLATEYWESLKNGLYINPTVNGAKPDTSTGRRIWYVNVTKVGTTTTPTTTPTTPTTTPTNPTTPPTTSNKFPYPVTLHIYLNDNVGTQAKEEPIHDTIAVDGVVSKKEVESVVKKYFTAKNSDGIKYDGLYLAQGNWVGNFAYDLAKYDKISDTNEMRANSRVDINVMIRNAAWKSSSTSNNNSNSTNPKTGDSVVMTISALGVTASALAAAYYVSKKRLAK